MKSIDFKLKNDNDNYDKKIRKNRSKSKTNQVSLFANN